MSKLSNNYMTFSDREIEMEELLWSDYILVPEFPETEKEKCEDQNIPCSYNFCGECPLVTKEL